MAVAHGWAWQHAPVSSYPRLQEDLILYLSSFFPGAGSSDRALLSQETCAELSGSRELMLLVTPGWEGGAMRGCWGEL